MTASTARSWNSPRRRSICPAGRSGNGRLLDGPKQAFDVYGPTCDPLDRLPNPVTLPTTVTDGDWIEFGMVGAYGAATVTRFNGYGTIASIAVDTVVSGPNGG